MSAIRLTEEVWIVAPLNNYAQYILDLYYFTATV